MKGADKGKGKGGRRTGEEEPLALWICLISRLSTLAMGREMGRIGFGPGQFFFLAELYREEGLTQDELSRRVGVDKSNTSRAIAKLEEYGLIRREKDAGNHRIKRIFLEPGALAIRRAFAEIQQRWNAALLRGIAPEDRDRLLASLQKVARNARERIEQEGFIAL